MRFALLIAVALVSLPCFAQSEPPIELPAAFTEPMSKPTVEVGGAVQLDAGFFQQTPGNVNRVGLARDGAAFRTARIWAKGTLRENVGYMLEMDFGGLASANPGRPNFQNAYLEAQELPGIGTARLGRWKQPFSLETATSIRFLTFIERASLFAFVPFRRTGIGFFDHTDDESWTYAASLFRATDDGFGDSLSFADTGIATAERLTRLVRLDDDGDHYLHLGAAHSWNDAPNGRVRFARFGEFGLSQTPTGTAATATPNQFDTGSIAANHYQLVGGEVAWVNGPVSLQGEAVVAFVDRRFGGTAAFTGWYASASWFVTGERRNYLPKLGAFDRVRPNSEFAWNRSGFKGFGAWELAARLSQVDTDDAPTFGGSLTTLTLGINWHWTAHAKLQFNYLHNVRTSAIDPTTRFDVYAVRTAFDF